MALPLLPVSAMVLLALVLVVFQVLHAVSTPSQDLIEGLWLGWGRERIRSRWPCGAALKGIVEEIVVKVLS